MKFNIYYHNDFDGLASSAIFSKFLLLKYGITLDDISFFPVDYNIKDDWPNYKLKKPCAVLDFSYHHETDWWFDHHSSPFNVKAVSKRQYTRAENFYWNTKFLSCPSLMISHFYTYFRKFAISLKRKYKELIKWSDIIDGATYESPSDLFGFDKVYININKTLAVYPDEKYFRLIINAFYNERLDLLTSHQIYQKKLNHIMKGEKEAQKTVSNIIQSDGVIAFYDQSKYDLPFQRYIAYHIFPNIYYRIAIYRKNSQFSVSVNYNNWRKEKNKINLGKICERYGGGGRFNVGAVLTDNHEDAHKIASKIKKHLKRTFVTQINLFP